MNEITYKQLEDFIEKNKHPFDSNMIAIKASDFHSWLVQNNLIEKTED